MVFPAASGCRWAAGERPGSLASADPETTKTWATAQVLRSVSGVQRTAPCRGPFARKKDRTGAGKSQAPRAALGHESGRPTSCTLSLGGRRPDHLVHDRTAAAN